MPRGRRIRFLGLKCPPVAQPRPCFRLTGLLRHVSGNQFLLVAILVKAFTWPSGESSIPWVDSEEIP